MGYSSRGGPIGCCCFCLIAGLALLIAGLVFLSRADPDARQKEIAAYNSAVTMWDAQAIADFKARGPFRVRVDIDAWANASTADVSQAAVQQGAGILPFPQDRAAFVLPPTPIQMFPGSAGAFYPSMVGVANNPTVKILYVYDVNNNLVTSVPIMLGRTQTNSVGSKSSCQYGRKSGGTCYVYLYFSGPICITLDQKSGSYAYAGGCALYFGDTAFAATYGIADPAVSQSPVNYGDVTLTASGNQPGGVVWASNIVIRSNLDPYAVATQVTGGYPGAFGERSAMLMRKGWIMAGVGIGLLAPFVLCLLGLCVCAFTDCMKGSRSWSGSVTQTQTTTAMIASEAAMVTSAGAVPITPSAPGAVAVPLVPGAQPAPYYPNANALGFRAAFSQRFLGTLDATNRPFAATGNALRTATSRFTRGARFSQAGAANNNLPGASPTGHSSLMSDNTLPGKGASAAGAGTAAPPMLATPMIADSSANPYAYPPAAAGAGGGSAYPPMGPMAGMGMGVGANPYPQPMAGMAGYPPAAGGYPPVYNAQPPGNRPSAL